MLSDLTLYQQAILTLAALVLFTSFILLAQTRVVSIIHYPCVRMAGCTGGINHRTGRI